MTTVVDQGRERHYELAPGALAPVRAWLDAVDSEVANSEVAGSEVVEPRFDDRHLDALDLEVRRTVRERGQRDAEAGSLDSASTQQDSASRHKETG